LWTALILMNPGCDKTDSTAANAPGSASSRPAVAGQIQPGIHGFVEAIACDRVSGWVCDAEQRTTPLDVEILSDDQSLGVVKADGYRKDLETAGFGDGRHGFVFHTPDQVRDGKPHQISVRLADTKTPLKLFGHLSSSLTCPSAK
jgi:hypothetical protein